jgi:hypothetical protein
LLRELLDATVPLRAGEGVDDAMIEKLLQVPVPSAFRASPWLRYSRPLLLANGFGRLAGMPFHYSPDTGLTAIEGLV